jgi:Lon-like protease
MSHPDEADMPADADGATPSVPAPDGPTGPDPVIVDGAGRRRTRTYVLGAVIGVVLAVVVAVSFIRLPYYRYAPGTLYPTEGLINVDGSSAFRGDGGQIDFTTVSSKKATVLDYLLARFDPAVEMIDADKVDGPNQPEQTRRINLEMMSDSKRDAEVMALRKLGYPVEVTGTGALVRRLGPGRPAEKVLKENDTIVAIDGQPVKVGDDAVKAIGARKPGDTITITVESAPGEPSRTETVTLDSRCDPDPAKACSPEDAAKPLLGVDLGTRDTQFKLPFTLAIDTKDVGGPSAGLALTLGVIDVLTPGSLTGGKHVATTGTISLDGTVGPIGGIRQKTFLARRSGVDLFIVPNEELDEARRWAGDMKVVGVGTLDEALAALAENGGNTDAVQQAAAAHTSGTTAH